MARVGPYGEKSPQTLAHEGMWPVPKRTRAPAALNTYDRCPLGSNHLGASQTPLRRPLDTPHTPPSTSSASMIWYAYPCSARNRCRCAANSWSTVSLLTTV